MAGSNSTVKVAYIGDASSLNRAGKQVERGLSALSKVALASGAVAGAALVKFGKSSLDAFQDLGKQAGVVQRQFGGTVEEASRLAFAAERTGVGVDGLSTGLRTLSKNLVGTKAKTKTITSSVAVATGAWRKQTTIIKDATGHFVKLERMVPVTRMEKLSRVVAVTNPLLAKLGFNTKDAHGKLLPMAQLLPKLAQKFKEMPDGAEKTALALQLFGRQGASLLPFLNKGAAGIKELEKQSDRLGLTMSGKDLDAIRKNAAAHKDFSLAVKGLEVQVGRGLFPILAKFSTFLASQGVPALAAISRLLSTKLAPAFAWVGKVIDKALTKVQSFIGGFQGKLDGTKFAKYGAKAKKAFLEIREAVVKQVVPAFKSFLREAASLGSTIASAVTPPLVALGGALLDNARFVVPLTAALLTIKGVMLAYEGVTTAVTTATEMWTAATTAAAVVQRFFMVTTIEATGAQRASTLSMIGARVASAAATVQIYAFIVAQKLATAAQWLLNAALTANPIGLIIAAVALLAAGLVIAWKHSETFRRIVTTAFEAVKLVAGKVATVIKVAFTVAFGFIKKIVTDVFNKIQSVIDKAKKAANAVQNLFGGGTYPGTQIPKGYLDPNATKDHPQTFIIDPKTGKPLAEGGIVKKRPGGMLARIGEGSYDEAVIPLKPGMFGGGGGGLVIHGDVILNKSDYETNAESLTRGLRNLAWKLGAV